MLLHDGTSPGAECNEIGLDSDTVELDGALALLRDTEPGEPWENAVTGCLTLLCSSGSGNADLDELLNRYHVIDTPAPGVAVFHTRLGLSLIDAIGTVENPHAHRIATDLIDRTTASQDGYAVRDVLAHSGCQDLLTGTQARELTDLVEACALDRGTCPGNAAGRPHDRIGQHRRGHHAHDHRKDEHTRTAGQAQ